MLRQYVPRQSFTHLQFWSVKDFEIFCKETNIHLEFKTFFTQTSNAIQESLGMATMLVVITKENSSLATTNLPVTKQMHSFVDRKLSTEYSVWHSTLLQEVEIFVNS